MRYGGHVIWHMIRVSFRPNFSPLFFINGRFLKKLKIARYDSNTIDLVAIPDEEVADAYVKPIKENNPMKGVRLDISLKGLDVEMPRTVSVEPIPDGLRVHFNKPPDPGVEPAITPVMIKRRMFKGVKRLKPVPKKVERIYLTSKFIRDVIHRHGYTALSHVGGSMFMFVSDPLSIRSVYLPIARTIAESREIVFASLPSKLFQLIGLSNKLLCYDFITDVDGRHYIHLLNVEECRW